MRERKNIYTLLHQDTGSAARTGVIRLPHGTVKTPAFMPVGTAATVKGMTKDDLHEIGFEIILANTYHLFATGRRCDQASGRIAWFFRLEQKLFDGFWRLSGVLAVAAAKN